MSFIDKPIQRDNTFTLYSVWSIDGQNWYYLFRVVTCDSSPNVMLAQSGCRGWEQMETGKYEWHHKANLINGLVLIRTVGKTQKHYIFHFIHFISTPVSRAKTPGAVKSLTPASYYFDKKWWFYKILIRTCISFWCEIAL